MLHAAAAVDHIAGIKGKAAAGLRDFHQLLFELSKAAEAAPDEVIRQVLDRSGYRRMLEQSTDPLLKTLQYGPLTETPVKNVAAPLRHFKLQPSKPN